MRSYERYHHIDFMRFVFAVIIVYFHVLHENGDIAFYKELATQCSNAKNIVAAYFIIGGVFLYRSYNRSLLNSSHLSVFEYIVGRVVRLAPVLIFAITLESVLSKHFNWERNVINYVFLQCSGLSLDYKGILWYVSSYFFVSVCYYAVLVCLTKRKALLLIAILAYLSLAFRINYSNGSIDGRETVFYVLNLGILRAVGEMGVGVLLAETYERIHYMKSICPPKKRIQGICMYSGSG